MDHENKGAEGAASSEPEEDDPFTTPRRPSIRLDQFLKWRGLAGTGGQAKLRIQGGEVRVNGVVETRRGRTLYEGDRVELDGETLMVEPLVP